MTPFYIFGMFRSGTTSLARAINAHPDMSCASDPAAPLFKTFRSHVAERLGQDIPPQTPLQDYYDNAEGAALFTQIWDDATLSLPVSAGEREDLIAAMLPGCRSYSANLAAHLTDLKGETFQELLDDLLAMVASTYPSNARAVGIKEVWSNEFAPAILRSDPRAKVVIVVRDPRAVAASKNVLTEKYPWDFLARQWRKTSAVALALTRSKVFAGRVELLRYEDLAQRPDASLRGIVSFLGLDWSEDILDASKYRDGDGSAWKQNSSHGATTGSFNARSVERWRSILSREQQTLVELICHREMSALGYDPETLAGFDQLCADPAAAPVIPFEQVAKWMDGQVDASAGHTQDSVRLACEVRGACESGALGDTDVRRLFLHDDLYAAVASR